MINIVFTGFFLLLTRTAFTQLPSAYIQNVRKADSLTKLKLYKEAAAAYSTAFAENDGKANDIDHYNAACVWSLSGNKDSAFYHLIKVAEKGAHLIYNHIKVDNDLVDLHNDPRWDTVLELIKANKAKEEAGYIHSLVAILDTVYQEDQKHRQGIVKMIEELGMESKEVKDRLTLMLIADSVNTIKITNILEAYGWLGPDQVGRRGALTIFLVIQHAPFEVQKKYLPMMREAVNNKKAHAYNLALLEDRVALADGKKQIYGSQLQTNEETGKLELSPLEAPDQVDIRRAAVGLGTLSEYLREFNIEWSVEAYKKQQEEKNKKVAEKNN
jgi:hypothetical protein